MRAAASSHIWRAPLPAELRPGTWHARVHAQDEYGRRLTTHLLFEVAASDIAT
jgi:hypothetical protein